MSKEKQVKKDVKKKPAKLNKNLLSNLNDSTSSGADEPLVELVNSKEIKSAVNDACLVKKIDENSELAGIKSACASFAAHVENLLK